MTLVNELSMLLKFGIALENELSRHTNSIVRQNYQTKLMIIMTLRTLSICVFLTMLKFNYQNNLSPSSSSFHFQNEMTR